MSLENKIKQTAHNYLSSSNSFYATNLRSALINDCGNMVVVLKKEGYKKITKKAMVEEVDRQLDIRAKRKKARKIIKLELSQKRDKYVCYLAFKDFVQKTSFENPYDLKFYISNNPEVRTDVREVKQWKKQYAEKHYSTFIGINKHWKSIIYDKQLSFVSKLFVTHIIQKENIGSLIIRDVYCAKKTFVHLVDLAHGVLLENNGKKIICTTIKEFNENIFSIGIKLTKEAKQKLIDIQESHKVCVKLSGVEEKFNLYNAILEVLK